MSVLCDIASKWGTDKATTLIARVPMEVSGHGYTPYYHELFADKRESVKKVLEIGIDVGRSLFMWQEYFPNALIIGLDADPGRLIDGGRIRSMLCDQGDLESLRRVKDSVGLGFDLILDDGSHDPIHQILTAKMLVPLLGPKGIYIIEDVMDPGKVTPYIPYRSEVKEFDVVRDPNSKLIVIFAGRL